MKNDELDVTTTAAHVVSFEISDGDMSTLLDSQELSRAKLTWDDAVEKCWKRGIGATKSDNKRAREAAQAEITNKALSDYQRIITQMPEILADPEKNTALLRKLGLLK